MIWKRLGLAFVITLAILATPLAVDRVLAGDPVLLAIGTGLKISGNVGIGTDPTATEGLKVGGGVAPSPTGIFHGGLRTVTDNLDYNGIGTRSYLAKTNANYNGHYVGLYSEILVDATNNKNWTETQYGGLIGVYSAPQTDVGSTGTISFATAYDAISSAQGARITKYVGYYAHAPTVVAPGTIGTVYQMYLEAPTVGTVANYALYTAGGRVHYSGLPIYGNNAGALAGGLVAGDLYRTNGDPDLLCIVH